MSNSRCRRGRRLTFGSAAPLASGDSYVRSWRSPWLHVDLGLGDLCEERLDLAVQGRHLLSEDVVAGFLAQEHEELADRGVDQAPLLGFALPRLCRRGLRFAGKLESFDGALDQARRDFPAAGFFDGRFPSELGLFRGQANPGSAEIRAPACDADNLSANV